MLPDPSPHLGGSDIPLSEKNLFADLYQLTMAQAYWSSGRTADAVFSGQEVSGYVLFTGLDPDVRDIQVTVKDAVLRYDYRGGPIQTVDFTYRFER